MIQFQYKRHYFITASILFFIEVAIALFLKSGFIRHTFGDFLVVIFMYTAIRALINLTQKTTAVFVLAIAFIVELLQLTPTLELVNLNHNQIARIIFGTTFQFTDLLAYTLGVITILFIEKYKNEKLKKHSY